jgi:hypothetical protein
MSELQSPALLVDSEPQLWTAMVSSIKEETVFADEMNTVQVERSHLKGEIISYKKMPLFISGAPAHKKIQKFTKLKMTDFAKIPEIGRPIHSGQAFFIFIPFHPKNMWQRNRNRRTSTPYNRMLFKGRPHRKIIY